MKSYLDQCDLNLPLGFKFDRYTKDALSVFESWLILNLALVQSKRESLEINQVLEKEFEKNMQDLPVFLKNLAE